MVIVPSYQTIKTLQAKDVVEKHHWKLFESQVTKDLLMNISEQFWDLEDTETKGYMLGYVDIAEYEGEAYAKEGFILVVVSSMVLEPVDKKIGVIE